MTRFLLIVAVLAGAAGAAAEEVGPFARCLTRAGATYFRTAWCPHCAAQEKMFGGARAYLGEIDCTRPRSCGDVRSFPTWTFRDGSRLSGVLTFAELSERTGCAPPVPRTRPAPDTKGTVTRSVGGITTDERTVGGMRMIEVR
jgi:hypothetical protein